MTYGQLPKVIGYFKPVKPITETFVYQDMPIKLAYDESVWWEDRLNYFYCLLDKCFEDFYNYKGWQEEDKSYIYITAKRQYQKLDQGFNRAGWHSDLFKTDGVSYLWMDSQPTVFNCSRFNLSDDEYLSMEEMEQQALPENNVVYPRNSILRLNQYCIHRRGQIIPGYRTFVKISFSDKRFDLEGNTHNYLLDYDWDMFPRNKDRNVPYSEKSL